MAPGARRVRATLISCALIAGSVLVETPARAAVPVHVGFDEPVSIDTGSYAYATSIADVTGDGLVDLIVGNTGLYADTRDYRLVVIAQEPGGSLAPPAVSTPTMLEGEHPSLVNAAGDLDGDGDLDVAVGTVQGLDVFAQAGGVLTGPTNHPEAGEVFDVQIADMNGDARDDVVYTVLGGDPEVFHRYQNGTGTLDAPVSLGSFPGGESVAVGDVNGDGRPDVVIEDGSPSGLGLLLQQEDGSFVADLDDRVSGVSIAVFGDVTGDGRDDLIMRRDATNALAVMAGNAGAPLSGPVGYATGASGDLSIEVADLNGDATADVAVLATDGTAIFLQDDLGVLHGPCPAPVLLEGAIGGKEVTAIGDLDGDDVPDLVGGGVRLGVSRMAGFGPGETYASTLELSATNDVELGGTIALSGEVIPDFGCVDPGAAVTIWRAQGSAEVVVIGTAPVQDTSEGFTFSFEDTPAAAGRYHYHATFDGAGVIAGSESATITRDVSKLGATVDLAISDTSIRFGESIRLTARLRGPQTGTISFYGNVGGGKRLIDRVKVGARGKAVLEVKPSRHTTYTAEYPGTATFASAKSRERSVKVAAIVNGTMVKYQKKVSGTSVYPCCRAWFLTWVQPKKPAQQVKVTVQYWSGSAWRTLRADDDTFKLGQDGAALIYLDIAGGGGFRFRARATWSSDGQNLGGSSPWAPFRLDV